MAFIGDMRQLWYESWSDGIPTRRYWIGNTPINVQTICEMKRPIHLWMKEQGGPY